MYLFGGSTTSILRCLVQISRAGADARAARGSASLQKAEIGIIGGSGLYSMPGLTDIREERISTPFGDPSDSFILGKLEGRSVAFLARHGRGHKLLPSELNFRANIYGLKMLGVERILSLSAIVGACRVRRLGDVATTTSRLFTIAWWCQVRGAPFCTRGCHGAVHRHHGPLG